MPKGGPMDTKSKSKTLDLTALLACAFSRNKKMSHFIAEKYAVDRDAFFRYNTAAKTPRLA